MSTMRLLPAIVITCAAALSACNSSGCLDNGSSLPLAGFYSSATALAISIDSVEVYGLGSDSVMLAAGKGTSQVYLPFKTGDGATTGWIFRYAQADIIQYDMADTVVFTSSSMPYFASEECGAMYIYRIEGVRHTTHIIDSITIADSLITNVESERIRIYFRTAPQEEARR